MRVLIDGNGLACKLWWSAPHINVPQRFVNTVDAIAPPQTREVLVCWDSGHSWRRDVFPEYKAHRPPKPQALCQALLECQPLYDGARAIGYEADDLIATFAGDAGSADPVVIVSDDKDILQLVRPYVVVVSSAGGTRRVMGYQQVVERFGVPPDALRLLFSWMGDSSDGLPGVRGYGPKKAVPRALNREVGDQLTYDLVELQRAPERVIERWAGQRRPAPADRAAGPRCG